MAPTYQQVLDICETLSEQEQMNVTLKEAGKGFLFAGFGAALGTLLGGSIGLLIGGTLGSAGGAYLSRGKCMSVVDIIKYEMTLEQQQKLAKQVMNALQNFSSEDIIVLLPMVLNSESLKSIAVREIVSFLTRELGATVLSNSMNSI